MRDDRIRHTVLASFVLAGLLAAFTPAHATEVLIKSGSVMVPWFGPKIGTDEVSSAVPNGTFSYSFAIPANNVGKYYRIQYPRMNEQVVPGSVYACDLDVYFFNAEGWDTGDGTTTNWDKETGVNLGPESGNIPAGTNRAFVVMNARPCNHELPFPFDFYGTS